MLTLVQVPGPQASGIPPEDCRIYGRGKRTETDESHDDRVSGMVFRSVLGQEGEGCDDAPDITEADLPCCADTPVHMPLEAHDVPTYDDGTGRECAHGDEAETGVLRGEEVVDFEEDG